MLRVWTEHEGVREYDDTYTWHIEEEPAMLTISDGQGPVLVLAEGAWRALEIVRR